MKEEFWRPVRSAAAGMAHRTLAQVRRRFDLLDRAEALREAVLHGDEAGAAWMVGAYEADPEVFVEPCRSLEVGYESPLCAAACRRPGLALSMLAAGADPRSAPEGGSYILLMAAAADDGPEDERVRLELFGRLLGAGVDPGEPTAWICCTSPRYGNSLVAALILGPERGRRFLDQLLEFPVFDRQVWARPPDPPVPAEQFARATGAGWAVDVFERFARWSPGRRAWVGAVLRAPLSRRSQPKVS